MNGFSGLHVERSVQGCQTYIDFSTFHSVVLWFVDECSLVFAVLLGLFIVVCSRRLPQCSIRHSDVGCMFKNDQMRKILDIRVYLHQP